VESNKHLFSDFPDISTERWEEKIRTDLKGADYERTLIWQSDEGIAVKPYYRSEDLQDLSYLDALGELRHRADSPNGWTICQDIAPGRDLTRANERIKTALKGGAQSVRIHLERAPMPGKAMLKQLFEGVRLDATEMIFQGYLGADSLYKDYMDLATEKGIYPAKLHGVLGADPIGKMAATGVPLAITGTLGNLLTRVAEQTPAMRTITVNGALLQNAGSNLVQELAFALAMANEYLSKLSDQGIEALQIIQQMQLELASGANYFMEIAKIRALRLLWKTVCKAYGVDPLEGKIRIHSTTSQWNMTLYDPHVNLLRGTTEAMSAIQGGADLISVLPFDHPHMESNEFSDRIARNTQIILRDEAYLDRVADPAAGSYYIENLTDSIAGLAWELFQECEAKGGFIKAFEKGWIQEQVEASRLNKAERFSTGKDSLVGSNAFPNFNEMMLDQLHRDDSEKVSGAPLKALRPFRASEGFEALRLETESAGHRPRVFLLKHGNPAWVSARATFSGNFFACAGYEILDPAAFANLDDGIEKARESKADMVVLCSSDDAYAQMGPKAYDALKDDTIVVVAGHPKDSIDQLRQAGIAHFIHMKSKLLESLQEFNKLLLS
jgi:methylmalonyl-CoA mutase